MPAQDAAESAYEGQNLLLTTGRAAHSGQGLAMDTTNTRMGTRTLDMMQSTGAAWKIPRGFLTRYVLCQRAQDGSRV